MSKDVLTTSVGVVGAMVIAAKEYLAMQSGSEGLMDWQFWVGMGSAVLIAAFGYWAKKGE